MNKDSFPTIRNVLAIIPTYNERENIRVVIQRVLESDPRVSILVVDDNSPDGTGEIVSEIAENEPRVSLLSREGKLGLGTAYVAGFNVALERQFDAVVEIDADLSHSPEDIPRLIQFAEEAHFVIGSRYVNGVNVVNWPLQRLLLSYMASVYSRFVTGMPFRDLTAGFGLIRSEVLRSLDLSRIRSEGYSFQIEIKFNAWRKGFKLVECPIVFTERTQGRSKMSNNIVFEAMWRVWALRLSSLFRKVK